MSRGRSSVRTRLGCTGSTSTCRRRNRARMRLPACCEAEANPGGRDMRREEVYAQLAKVYDPELDQPLTELGFIGGVELAGSTVTVRFRLPTFWCAANFAFMIAADIRERVSELPWGEGVDVQLQGDFLYPAINGGA